jgi:hypothetical protein
MRLSTSGYKIDPLFAEARGEYLVLPVLSWDSFITQSLGLVAIQSTDSICTGWFFAKLKRYFFCDVLKFQVRFFMKGFYTWSKLISV